MSAYPFGGHPTFSTYLTWAAQKAACKVQTGYKIAKTGEALSMTRITAPNGKHVIVIDFGQDERLVPTFIAYLDRRLGLTSPWAFPNDDAPDR
jgi:hypothetical protein